MSENFNAVQCMNCRTPHRLSDPCPIILSRVELPCPSCASKDARIRELEEENERMEKSLERISEDGDDKGADMASAAEHCLEWLKKRRAKEEGDV